MRARIEKAKVPGSCTSPPLCTFISSVLRTVHTSGRWVDRVGSQCVQLLQSCPILCDLMDCHPPGSSVHGILQARILQGVVVPSSRGSFQPRDWTPVSCISCIDRWIPYHLHHLRDPGCYIQWTNSWAPKNSMLDKEICFILYHA